MYYNRTPDIISKCKMSLIVYQNLCSNDSNEYRQHRVWYIRMILIPLNWNSTTIYPAGMSLVHKPCSGTMGGGVLIAPTKTKDPD